MHTGLTIVFSLSLAASGCCGEPERLSRGDVAGALCVLVGVTGVSLAAPHGGAEPSLDDATAALTAVGFATPAACVLLAAVGCVCAPCVGVRMPVVLLACGAASCGTMSQLALKVVSLSVKEAVAAADGGLLPLPRPLAFVGLGGLAFSAPSQLILLSSALAARASLVVPLYQASLVSLTTLVGGVAFDVSGIRRIAQSESNSRRALYLPPLLRRCLVACLSCAAASLPVLPPVCPLLHALALPVSSRLPLPTPSPTVSLPYL